MRAILLGAPGVGKGTTAGLLVEHYGVVHISTGDMFRSALKNETKVGLVAKSYVEKGLLVPDNITNDLVEERLLSDDVKNGFLFDGYPRNLFQAEEFDKILKNKNWNLDAVIYITASDECVIERIAGRRVCPKCGAVYHITNIPPKVSDICDNCGTTIIQRKDDSKETVLDRLRIYKEQTKPLISYYEAKGLLVEVDGSKNVELTFKQIKEKFKG
ncbi:MAG: adenylate kinase [Acholeplasmatales bacterium]|jgi:adenylate kinase|nr:adenylate kinase [Acholeplasmatales bacterium]